MLIRKAKLSDLDEIANVENACFPITEAATKELFKERLKYYSNYFILMYDNNKLISFIDGFVTNEEDLKDIMYEDASMHNENGKWQMIFGVNTLPEYRKKGYASKLIKYMINIAKEEKRAGIVLTCKKELIPFYSKFGFQNEGISKSVHGNVTWYQMRLKIK